MPLLGSIGSLIDRYILGYAIGTAAGPSLEPFVQDLANEAWKLNQVYPIDPGDAAEVVAEDVEQDAWGVEQASQHGVSAENFHALVGAVLNAPGLADLYQLWRRGLIGDGDFVHGLRKARLEGRWDGPLEGLKDVLLSPAELANARQQGFMTPEQTTAEAALQGVTPDRSEIQYELAGLPPGIAEGLEMLRRGIITDADFAEIVRTGHTKTKWTGQLLALRDRVLAAAEYATLYLKGWITQAEMNAGGALTGYTPEQMNQLYLARGRPATVHQIHIGYARGAKLPGAANEHDAILTSVRESDIRPEYGELLYAQRYTYPSAFVLRGLVEGGALTAAEGEQALLFSGWEPTFAHKVAESWAGTTTGTTGDKHVTKAQTQLWTTTHRSYVAEEITDADAEAALAAAGVAASAVPGILALWGVERNLIRAQLSAAQIKKAYYEQVVNPATGQPWTQADALAALHARGYSDPDARTLLEL